MDIIIRLPFLRLLFITNLNSPEIPISAPAMEAAVDLIYIVALFTVVSPQPQASITILIVSASADRDLCLHMHL